jgi:hypothetical protein
MQRIVGTHLRSDIPHMLRVVRGDGKGTQCPGVYLGHPVPGGYKYGDLALQVGGVSRIGTIKYGLVPRDCAGEDQQQQ